MKPEEPKPVDGVMHDILMYFESEILGNVGDGNFLKLKWTKLKSSYTAAYKNFSVLEHSDGKVFPNLTQRDAYISYIPFIFRDNKRIGAVVRLIP